MRLILTLLFLTQFSFAKTDVDYSAFCQLMLSADVEPIQALSENLLRDFRADSGGDIEYLENMHGVMTKLIEDQTITQAQADTFFAEKTLGSFARIFLKYTITEDKA